MSFKEIKTAVGNVVIGTTRDIYKTVIIDGGSMDGDTIYSETEDMAFENHGMLTRRVRQDQR
jgi:hypothetical protein